MRMPAKMIRAALTCVAKNDVRFYLCGINITKKHIEATNGHTAIQMTHGVKRVKSGVYKIKGRIPAKCLIVQFVLRKDIKIVNFLGLCDEVLGVAAVEIVDGKFPNITEKVLKPLLEKPINNDVLPLLNADYLAIPSKAFTGGRWPPGINIECRGEEEAALLKMEKGFPNEEYGNPVIIIMPVRRNK